MKNLLHISLLISFVILNPCLHAKDNKEDKKEKPQLEEKHDKPFEREIRMYKAKAQRQRKYAESAQDPELKSKLLEMAGKMDQLREHKEKAQQAKLNGKDFDWTEYEVVKQETHELSRQIAKMRKGDRKPEKDPAMKKDQPTNEEVKQEKPEAKSFKTASGFEIKTKL
jgi:hypothetical protein